MQGPCQTVDASQLLRDILQNKEKYQDKIIDNNNSTSSNGSGIFPSIDCNSEMISPLLQSKSSDMAYNDRDNDTEGENDNDIDVTVDNNSTVNSGDESDLDVRSLEPGDLSKGSENGLVNGETKAAKRAHVENILSSMRKSPLEEEMENAMRNSTGVSSESKRQKRKQPQPQQHDSAILNTSDYPMHIMQLQCNIDDRMQTVKRKREDCDDVVCSDIDDDDTINDDDIDVSTDDGRVKVSTPLLGNDAKRAHAQRILSAIRSPNYPCENGVESQHDVSPNGDGSKKQKRKQAQPQQHDGKMMSAIDLEEFRFRHGSGNKLYSSKGDGSVNGDEVGRDSPNNNNINNNISNSINNNHNIHNNIHSTLFPNHDAMFRASLFRGLNEKDFTLPFHNGVDPHLYRENLFRHPLFGLRPDLDPMAAFRNMSRGHPGRIDPELLHGGQRSLSPTQVTKISEALKNELNQAVSKAIDKALSKVFSDKHLNNNKEENSAEVNAQPPQDSQRQQQQTPKSQPTPLIPPQFPLLPHHNQFSQQQHQQQQQQQQQQHHHQHQQPQQQSQHSPSHASDREAHKENVNNSQGEKKPELTVPFSDHLQLLERFGSRVHPEKVSAFEPLYKSESELITPHTGPSMPFHPPFPYYLPTQTVPNTFTGEPEQTEALPLIVNTPKKKRTKVTDTRLSSPRTKPSLLSESSPGSSSLDQMEHQRHLAAAFTHFMPQVLPTSVAITNPSLNHSDLLALRLREASFGGSRLPSPHDQSRSSPCSPNTDSPHFMMKMEMYERSGLGLGGADVMDGQGNGSHMITLTPMHLRKAKLMFFYSRYPSSSVLKMYFPDVMFNKNNTAQLVKWFSNFREFFYIQMEKYARQAQAEGCKHADDLVVTADSELFRHLNLHYNRNNQVEVPENFHLAVEAALKEFFKAIQANKDAEPSWKKAIYKIISRMDETLPEFFKSANWMEQLGDQ